MEEMIAETVPEPTLDTASLEAEIDRLRLELASREAAEKQSSLWAELFPGMSDKNVSPEVKAAAEREGIPIIAAYALHVRREEMKIFHARYQSMTKGDRTPGACRSSMGGDTVFSLDEIRAMTPAQVKRHYRQIIKSLGKS